MMAVEMYERETMMMGGREEYSCGIISLCLDA